MNTKFIPPELQDTVVGLDGQRPSGSVLESIGNGRYAVTLPDGQQVIVEPARQHHRLKHHKRRD